MELVTTSGVAPEGEVSVDGIGSCIGTVKEILSVEEARREEEVELELLSGIVIVITEEGAVVVRGVVGEGGLGTTIPEEGDG